MTATLKQDAQLADFALLAYHNEGLPLNDKPLPVGWTRIDKKEEGSFADFAYQNTETKEVAHFCQAFI